MDIKDQDSMREQLARILANLDELSKVYGITVQDRSMKAVYRAVAGIYKVLDREGIV